VIETSLHVNLGGEATGFAGIFRGMMNRVEKDDDEFRDRPLAFNGKENEYLLSTSLTPPWSKMSHAEIICAETDRKALRWTIELGDLVAVQSDRADFNPKDCFPYTVSWRPGQILAIYRESKEKDNSKLFLEIRWFCRSSDEPALENTAVASSFEMIYETDDVSGEPIDTSKLLGPVTILSGPKLQTSKSTWSEIPPYLPRSPFIYGGRFNVANACRTMGSSTRGMLERGLLLSRHYGDRGMEVLQKELPEAFQDLEKATGDSSTAVSADRAPAWISVPPFHVDQARAIEYFSELDIDVISRYQQYSIPPPEDVLQSRPVWTARLGDPVIIHSEGDCKKALYGLGTVLESKAKKKLYWPFAVKWAVGEIVTIFKCRVSGRIKLEIRWIYRAYELPGCTKSDTQSTGLDHCCEEIFESDHYTEVAPSSILAPADLRCVPSSAREANTFRGMPFVKFFCKRFWSTRRKSLVPIGGPAERIKRGRTYSNRIGTDVALKASLERTVPSARIEDSLLENPSSTEFTSWEDAFKSVIKKLSLTEASKEAYADGSVLIGREKQRRQIKSFLRAAITGDADGNKSSLFVAGPPGGGKTAVSVHQP
jgi:hypothetical protein